MQRRPRVPFDPSGSCEIYRLLSCGQFVLALESTLLRLLDMGYIEAAGVHRYNRNLEDVVRGDSLLLVVHTKQGGPRDIMLPHPAKLCEALSGEMIGQGQHLSVKLPPSTTAIWKLTRD